MDQFRALNELKLTTNDGKSLKPAILTVFQAFETNFSKMFADLKSEFLKVCEEQSEQILKLSTEVSDLKKQVSSLEEKIDEQDAYERRDTLIFSGSSIPVFNAGENCPELVKNLVQNEFQLIISPTDISVSHRLGRKPTNQRPDKRNLIVKFCRRDTKRDILAASRRVKSQNLYANESLVPQRQSIAYALRKAKRDRPNIISGSTTIEGKVFVFVKAQNPNDRDTRIEINTLEKLETFCQRNLNQSASNFLPPRQAN